MTSLRVREGWRWASEEALWETEGPWSFFRRLPGESAHHLRLPSLSESHCFSVEPQPLYYIFPQRSPSAVAHFMDSSWVKKSFDESAAKCLSHPALVPDNDGPPAIAEPSGAEDKCHFQLSVMRSGFDYIILMVLGASNCILPFCCLIWWLLQCCTGGQADYFQATWACDILTNTLVAYSLWAVGCAF